MHLGRNSAQIARRAALICAGAAVCAAATYRFAYVARGYGHVFRELAAGIEEVDAGRHLITFHPTTYFSKRRGGSSISPDFNPWANDDSVLKFDMIQTYAWPAQVKDLVKYTYDRSPIRPVVLAEGAYEAATDYPGLPRVSPLLARRQAYEAYLGGAFYTYGHTDICCSHTELWRAALDAPGAKQMAILRSILESREWWTWTPDQSAVLASSCGFSASRSADGGTIVVYLQDPCAVSVDLGTLRQGVAVTWIDPRSGAEVHGGMLDNSGVQRFVTPAGLEDALLLLESERPPALNAPPPAPKGSLRTSVNNRYFVDANNRPFLWLGDTAWLLFTGFSPSEADEYLDARRRDGFNVLQAVIAVHKSEQSPEPRSSYTGQPPFIDNDPNKPNEAYFRNVDELIRKARAKGFVVALLPVWGLYVTKFEIVNERNARAYGRWLATRYANDPNIIWVLGGDTSVWGFHRQSNTLPLIAKDTICYSPVLGSICPPLKRVAHSLRNRQGRN